MCVSSQTDPPGPPQVHLGEQSSLPGLLSADTSLMCVAESNTLPDSCPNVDVVAKENTVWKDLVQAINNEQYKRGTENLYNVFPCVGAGVLASVGLYCVKSGLQQCVNKDCQNRKARFLKSMPSCKWEPFTDWLLTALACHAGSWATTRLYIITYAMATFCDAAQSSNRPLKRNMCLDLQGTFDLLLWARRTCSDVEDLGRLLPEQMRRVFSSRAWELSHEARQLGICSKRLWDVATVSLNGIIGVSPIVQMMRRHDFRIQDRGHQTCTEQVCVYGDDNSTVIHQLHKCLSPESCGEVEFPASKLNTALRESEQWHPTAWSVDKDAEGRSVLGPGAKYIAISHVWLDGTGVGLKRPGFVNECLDEFFTKTAQRLGCHGVWWDTVCIPTAKEERRKAMDSMLSNYSNAEYTIVHDQGLIQFGWKDDGTPCIALLLSAWFTRGWTAAELFSSKRVKVLFKNPAGGEPLIKDLDEDILAWEPSLNSSDKLNYPEMGYYIASDIIKRYRSGRRKASKDISNFRDLMTLLRQRTTSWARDRMLIAGLMTLPPGQFDSSSAPAAITKAILRKFRRLSIADLYHSEVPLGNSGPWSWCPPSLFDLGRAQTAITRGGDMLNVGADGTLEGYFHAQTLTAEDARLVLPYSAHPAVSARVYEALSRWQNCVLLRDEEYTYPLFVLAVTLEPAVSSSTIPVVDCRYVGCVYLPAFKSSDGVRHMVDCRCRFGSHEGDHGFSPERNAAEILYFLRMEIAMTTQGYPEVAWADPGDAEWSGEDSWRGYERPF